MDEDYPAAKRKDHSVVLNHSKRRELGDKRVEEARGGVWREGCTKHYLWAAWATFIIKHFLNFKNEGL